MLFRFDTRLNGAQALERLIAIEAIWLFLDLVNNFFECIMEWTWWQFIHLLLTIPLSIYVASVITRRMNDIGWSKNIGFGGGAIIFITNAVLLVFAQYSLIVLIAFALFWIIAAGALFYKPSEPNSNSFGDVPEKDLQMHKLLISLAFVAGIITAGLQIDCNKTESYEAPRPTITPTPLPSSYRSCIACCDAKGYLVNCGCRNRSDGTFQCYGG